MKPFKKCVFYFAFLLITSSLAAQDNCVDYWDRTPFYQGPWNPIWNFPDMKQKKVVINTPNGGIGNDYFFFGMLEHLPDDYNPSNTSVKHPLILFFHGGASRGNARQNIDNLCRLFKDQNNDDLATYKSIPGRVERNTEAFTQDGKKFIVISPQFEAYRRSYPEPAPPNQNVYPSAQQVENVINYVLARYPNKIDETRIYLTGYSNGANMIMEYVGSSVARARRVAAVVPVSLCSQLTHFSNTAIGVNAANIAEAQLKTWFIHCTIDNPCSQWVPDEWYNAIIDNGGVTPRYTVLRSGNANPLYKCSDTLLHDAWSRAYDPNFRASFVGGIGANDGINQNVYEWMMAQTNAIVPVVMKSYTARLISNKYVQLEWVTTDEKNNAHFTIERAGTDQQFVEIAQIEGAGNNVGERKYTYRDDDPLGGLSHYRLSQTDFDGKKTIFEIKKIINRNSGENAVVVSPNPVVSDLSAFVNLARSQKVVVYLTDLSGKILKTKNGIYGLGSSEIKIQAGELSSGVYLLKVAGEDFSVVQKIVKR